MALYTFSSTVDNATTTTFRAWVQQLSQAMDAAGFVKATGVGTQIDYTTVNLPATTNTSAGYEIRLMNNTSAVGLRCPIFVKIEYGSNTVTTRPALWVTIGTACDSSGNLTNPSTRVELGGGQNGPYTGNGYVAYGGDWVVVATGMSNSSSSRPMFFTIGRTRNDAGAVTSEGVNFLTVNAIYARTQIYYLANGTFNSITGPWHCAAPPSGAGTYGSYLGIYPIFVSYGAALNTDATMLCAFNTDMGGVQTCVGNTVKVTIYGQLITYYCAGYLGGTAVNGNGTANTCLLRYESQ